MSGNFQLSVRVENSSNWSHEASPRSGSLTPIEFLTGLFKAPFDAHGGCHSHLSHERLMEYKDVSKNRGTPK